MQRDRSAARSQIESFLEDVPKEFQRSPAAYARGVAHLAERAAHRLMRRKGLEKQMIEAHGFALRESRNAIAEALLPVKRDSLLEVWKKELGPWKDGGAGSNFPSRTVVFGGGAIPQPTVQAVIAAAMVSRSVFYRPAATDPLLAPLLIETMKEIESEDAARAPTPNPVVGPLASRLYCATWPREETELTRSILHAADSFVFFGGSSALAELQPFLRPNVPQFIYGPRISFAALDLSECRTDKLLKDAVFPHTVDIARYDQRGCLSPAVLYLLGGNRDQSERVLNWLAALLESQAFSDGYTRHLPPSAAARIHSLRSIYSMDPSGARRTLHTRSLPGWTLLLDESDPQLRPTPGYQTLFICPVAGWDELLRAVAPFHGQLQAMGLGPEHAECPEAARRELEAMGLSRICPLGQMQYPPLDWVHDGNPFFPIRTR